MLPGSRIFVMSISLPNIPIYYHQIILLRNHGGTRESSSFFWWIAVLLSVPHRWRTVKDNSLIDGSWWGSFDAQVSKCMRWATTIEVKSDGAE